MNTNEKEQIADWVNRWKQLTPFLENLKQQEIRSEDIQRTIELLEDAFKSALLHHPPGKTSGLVEQQRLFMKACR